MALDQCPHEMTTHEMTTHEMTSHEMTRQDKTNKNKNKKEQSTTNSATVDLTLPLLFMRLPQRLFATVISPSLLEKRISFYAHPSLFFWFVEIHVLSTFSVMCCVVLCCLLFSSHLFYCMLFYSILCYSILFSSPFMSCQS